MKNIFLTVLLTTCTGGFVFAQNIGIGTSSPNYKLDVTGTVHGSSNAFFDGFVGVGTTTPSYKLRVNDGSIALFNSTDTKT